MRKTDTDPSESALCSKFGGKRSNYSSGRRKLIGDLPSLRQGKAGRLQKSNLGETPDSGGRSTNSVEREECFLLNILRHRPCRAEGDAWVKIFNSKGKGGTRGIRPRRGGANSRKRKMGRPSVIKRRWGASTQKQGEGSKIGRTGERKPLSFQNANGRRARTSSLHPLLTGGKKGEIWGSRRHVLTPQTKRREICQNHREKKTCNPLTRGSVEAVATVNS